MDKEKWRMIPDYEGSYMVSNFGNVKALNYARQGKEKLLKPILLKIGYYGVNLSKNNRHKLFFIHRLVAQAFIPNPENLPCVNHKDEDKTNNQVENLEWCSYGYNINYGKRNEKHSEKMCRPVEQYTLDNEFVGVYKSAKEAAIFNKGIWQGNISKCCRGVINQTGGYLWRYI